MSAEVSGLTNHVGKNQLLVVQALGDWTDAALVRDLAAPGSASPREPSSQADPLLVERLEIKRTDVTLG